MPTDSTPSKNENEYFARENLELIKRLRAERDAQRAAGAPGGATAGEAGGAAAGTTMTCPRCGGTLVEREYHHVRIDECASCGGTWLDKGELALLEHVEPEHRAGFLGGLFGRQR